MSVPFSNTKLRTPAGFRNVMWVLAREVIRDSPSDTVEFAADFMHKLVHIREETGHDPAQHGMHEEDRFYHNYVCGGSLHPQSSDRASNHTVQEQTQVVTQPTERTQEQEEEIDIDLNDPAVEEAALKIQTQFKGFKAKKLAK